MYVEPSALVAILMEEPERDQFLAKIIKAERPFISIVGKVEAAISFGRSIGNYAAARLAVSETLTGLGVDVIDMPADIFDEIMRCYERYGKGTGHRVQLNFGDCFSYAVAKRLADGLILFKGGDFLETDLVPA